MEERREPGTEAQLRLALRIIEHFHMAGQARDRLLPGRLPPDFPFQLSLPPDGLLIGSRVIGDGSDINVYVDTSLGLEEAVAFYKKALEAFGWSGQPIEHPEPFPTLEERFGDSDEDEILWDEDEDFISPDGSLTATVGVHETAEGLTSVVLYVGGVPIEREPFPWDAEERRMVQLLPRLDPPAGAEQEQLGFSGSSESAERRVDVRSDLAMGAFAEHYDRVISMEDWRRIDGETTTRSAWSAWERHAEQDEGLYLLWFALKVPRAEGIYTVIEQIGQQGRSLPPESWMTRR